MLSIIIPSLNEEKYLPLLLKSIKKQDFRDYEIIVADAGSKDKTLEIARKYGCKIVSGGLPAKGRNEGAKIAKGNIFLFLDAEAVLPEHFLKKTLLEFRKRKLGIASCGLEPITENKLYKLFYDLLYNWPVGCLENVFPYASNFIFSKREVHQRIGGFDEEIKLAEDHFYARQAAKTAKFGFLRSVKLIFSPRRFQHEGWLMISMKYYFCNFYNIFFGDVKSNIFKYELKNRKEKKEKSKIKKVILTIVKLPFYPIWFIFACLGWLVVFLIFSPKLTAAYLKKKKK
jgi:glycosyltransferase involved in cell wall biosynthesis